MFSVKREAMEYAWSILVRLTGFSGSSVIAEQHSITI